MNHFNFKLYKTLYKDLEDNNINTEDDCLRHWKTYGKNENRIASINEFIKSIDFDYKFYIDYYKLIDVKTPTDAVIDWLTIGKEVGRVFKREHLHESEKRKIFNVDNDPIKSEFFRLNNNFNLSFLSEQKKKICL